MKAKKKIAILVAILLLFSFTFVIAATDSASASKYPSIGGVSIDENTTAAQYLIYIFNLLAAAGLVIAVAVLVMAGVTILTSAGEPAKLSEAKGKIKNAFFGIIILLGSYLILSAINSDLLTVKVTGLECNQGIQVETSDGKKECVTDTMASISYEIASTIKWYVDPKTLYKVYIYPEINFAGTPTSVALGSGDISRAKSIYFIKNNTGLYLYNGVNYEPGNKPYPTHITETVDDLNTYNIENSVSSIDIVNPSDNSFSYHAVAFADAEKGGQCSFIGGISIPNMSTSMAPYYGLPSVIYNGTLSSMVVFKEYKEAKYRGSVYLYKVTNCGGSESAGAKYLTLGSLLRDQMIELNCKSSAPGADWNGSMCVCPSGYSNPTVTSSTGSSYVNTDICIQNNSSAAAGSGMTTPGSTSDDENDAADTGTTGDDSSGDKGSPTGDTKTDDDELKPCKLDVGLSDNGGNYIAPAPQVISEVCSKYGWKKSDKVASFKLTGGAVGIVLVSSDDICEYWDINTIGEGTCESIIGKPVYPNYWSKYPVEIMAFPVDKK